MKLKVIVGALILLFSSFCYGSDGGRQGKEELTYKDAVVLGIVQGITEFLPISSTGHLIISNKALGLDNEDVRDGPISMKQAADIYAIVIQGGTILAIVILYWDRIVMMLFGLMGKDRRGWLLARNIVLAFLPAVVVGLLFEKWINAHLFSPLTVIIALVAGAFLMFGVERWRGRKGRSEGIVRPTEIELYEMGVRKSLLIGFMQCFAMWPGTSRSMMTIVGGYFAGLSARKAAEFSFLLGLVTLTAASVYKGYKDGGQMLQVLQLGPVLVGALIAFISGAFAVKWLISYLTRHGLGIFAWYRLGLAMVAYLVLYIL